MHKTTPGRLSTMALVAGAVVFGMVLASGANAPAPAFSSPAPYTAAAQGAEPVHVAVAPGGLPGFADLAEAVEPAVVSIHATTFEVGSSRRGPNPFEFFFGPRGPRTPEGQPEQPDRSDSGGSGFVISSDGLIVTNFHVVRGASDLKVTLNGREYEAEVKGTDPETDIALIQVQAESQAPLRFLALGDSDPLRVGDWVMAIGSPLSLDKSVTVGVVSAKGRNGLGIGNDNSFENFIQTDAAINFGNSGGPLVNLQGEVVGIATAINYGAENIGFAVPVNTLKQILPQLRAHGAVRRGYMGVSVNNLDYRMAEAFGLESTEGVLVADVRRDTPAEKAGLRHGDVILKVDGKPVGRTRELIDYVSNQGPEATVSLDVLRGDERKQIEIELTERPVSGGTPEAEPEEGESGIDWLGLDYQDLTPGVRSNFGIPDRVEGVWITNVEPTSPLYEENVRPGQIVTEVNGTSTPSVEAFEEVVRAAPSGEIIRLYVEVFDRSGGSNRRFAFVRVP